MKKTSRRTRNKIVRYTVTYFVCLLLAVLTWMLVMYAEHEAKNGKNADVGTQESTVLFEPDRSAI